MPKPPSSACCTSHTHAPTRPPAHPTMPSTRHLSLTSQLTNTSPAHMQPGIHQSRPPPNVLRSSHYHHNQNTLTSQLKHPPHTCHPCLTNPTLPPTSLVVYDSFFDAFWRFNMSVRLTYSFPNFSRGTWYFYPRSCNLPAIGIVLSRILI